jgi:scyllo-inositol 2-dehydrogenase (NADP+)
MDSPIRIGMVGLGKMGLSHHAIVNAHPGIKVAAACDTTTYLTDVLAKYSGLKCYADLDRMLAEEQLDAVVVSTPSKLHAGMVEKALQRGLHVFCEKPFVLNVADGERLVALAEEKGLVNQVGYHYRFVGAFQEAARIARSGALGEIHHVRAEAYGPVVLRAKGGTWRSAKSEGGGALYDYACHAIDALNFMVGPPQSVSGVMLGTVFSRDVDDEVYCTLHYPNGASGQLAVNWSDESFRKMSTKISIWGKNGRINVDRQECQVYLREPHAALPGVSKGWTVRYTTDLTQEVWFYLRGEEYSAQIDYFVQSIRQNRRDGQSTFRSALETDRVAGLILAQHLGETPEQRPRATSTAAHQPQGFWSRLVGGR